MESIALLMTAYSLVFALALSPIFGVKTSSEGLESSPQFTEAEHSRLSGEIRNLARKRAWKGVDQTYDRIARLEVEMSLEDHLYGARASTELGDVGEAFERLSEAVKLQPEREVVDWLWDIEHRYGRVELSAPESSILEAAGNSLDPVERRAIRRAVSLCEETGTFQGLLPEGLYTFAGREFEVISGEEIDLVIVPERRTRALRSLPRR